jgi:hypothetical protein
MTVQSAEGRVQELIFDQALRAMQRAEGKIF